MRHLCTCGHETAPEDGVEPIGIISHETCAKCYLIYKGNRDPYWYPIRIGGFDIRLHIQPGRDSPHVSYDSPRKWDPPQPFRVLEQRVSRDGVELDPAEFRDLLNLACERANVPVPDGRTVSRPAFSRQLPLALDEGHL